MKRSKLCYIFGILTACILLLVGGIFVLSGYGRYGMLNDPQAIPEDDRPFWEKFLDDFEWDTFDWENFPFEDYEDFPWEQLPWDEVPEDFDWKKLPYQDLPQDFPWENLPLDDPPPDFPWQDIPWQELPGDFDWNGIPWDNLPEDFPWAELPWETVPDDFPWEKVPWGDVPVEELPEDFPWEKVPWNELPENFDWSGVPWEDVPLDRLPADFPWEKVPWNDLPEDFDWGSVPWENVPLADLPADFPWEKIPWTDLPADFPWENLPWDTLPQDFPWLALPWALIPPEAIPEGALPDGFSPWNDHEHIYLPFNDGWEVMEEATCGDPGYMRRYCLICKASEKKVIPATRQHTLDGDRVCSVCHRRMLVVSSNSVTETYTGTAIADARYTVDMLRSAQLLPGHRIVVRNTSSLTGVGKTPNAFSLAVLDGEEKDVSSMYAIEKYYGTLEVKARAIVLVTESESKQYDGEPLTCERYSVEGGLAAGDILADVVFGEGQTDYGKRSNMILSYRIVNARGEDVTRNYTVTLRFGTLQVTR